MIDLILSILSSAAVALIMRLSTHRVKSRYGMLAGNYIVCLAVSLFYLGGGSPLPAHEALPFTLGVGVINGIFYLVSFVLIQYSTAAHGVVVTSLFSRLGVLVPTALAVAVFGERPTLAQTLGFALAVGAILFMDGGGIGRVQPALLVLLITNGMANGMSTVYDRLGSADLADHFLLYTFFFALVCCAGVVLYKRERPGPADLAFGVLIGIPNYFSSRFLLAAVGAVPSVIVYPSFSVGSILLVAAAGVLFFKEKLTRRQGAALAVILAALVLLNI